MSPLMFGSVLFLAAYLIGAIPFGYLIARARGVDLFQVGSGNIGATNVGRVLGRKYGILVFILDFCKGALPVLLVPPLYRLASPENAEPGFISIDLLRVGVAVAAFLGHIFPVYLRFNGGKGVATGTGAMYVLVPVPALIATSIWLSVVAASETVSLASVAAAIALVAGRCLTVSSPLSGDSFIVTAFCLFGALIVTVKHRTNLIRLWHGNENRIEARAMTDSLSRMLHLLALGLWMGSSLFFSFVAAPKIFTSFKELVQTAPSDRTAFVPITSGLDDARKDQLGNALAGAAVGPIFPLLFGLHALCGVVAMITALRWWSSPGRVSHWRVYVIGLALALVVVSWPVSQKVTELRLARFSSDGTIAEAAKNDFAKWHLYSLGLSFLTTLLALVALMLAAKLPAITNSARRSPQQ